jgi:3-oxoacyl-[acyl-carrier-protein] synthase III
MRYAQIVSTGLAVPERVVTNAEVEKILGEPVDQWLVENVGIRERRFMRDDQATSDLAAEAGGVALARAGVSPEQLDLLIVTTDTPDYISPATASVVQAKLGAKNAGTFDLNCACAAWVTGLDVASKYLASDTAYSHILLTGVYGMSRYINWQDKRTATLFADGAGAVLLRAGERPGFLASKLFAAGEYYDALGIYTGGTAKVANEQNIQRYGPPYVAFVKKFPKTFNTDHWPPLIREVLARVKKEDDTALTPDDVDHYYFTQLNLRTIEAMMELLGQPLSKTHWIMDKWGYTGSACIPMALDDAIQLGKGPRPGDLVLFCASGGGLAMAVALFKWV